MWNPDIRKAAENIIENNSRLNTILAKGKIEESELSEVNIALSEIKKEVTNIAKDHPEEFQEYIKVLQQLIIDKWVEKEMAENLFKEELGKFRANEVRIKTNPSQEEADQLKKDLYENENNKEQQKEQETQTTTEALDDTKKDSFLWRMISIMWGVDWNHIGKKQF